jgi:hypothetical protein
MAKKTEFNKARFVRQVLVNNEGLTLETLHAEWKKEKSAPRKLPLQQEIYVVCGNIRKKYGVSELPYVQGKLNFSALARGLKRLKPSMDAKKIHAIMTKDGFKITEDAINKGLRAKDASHPDPKAGKGARAGKPVKVEPVKTDRRQSKNNVTNGEIMAVKGLLKELGGAEAARRAIEAIESAGGVKTARLALDAYEDIVA